MQDDINHYVTWDRVNNARQRVDPISKNIFRHQNPLKLVFKNISTFDAQNLIVGSLLQELDIVKKDIASSLIKKLLHQALIWVYKKDSRHRETTIANSIETIIMEDYLHLHHLCQHLIISFHQRLVLPHHLRCLIYYSNPIIFHYHHLCCRQLLYQHCCCQDQDQNHWQLNPNHRCILDKSQLQNQNL